MKTLTVFPLVSIVIPVYNGEETLFRCLTKLIAQSYPADKMEIIVVNNNSTDGTQKIIDGFNVISVFEKKAGPSAARNTGIKRAGGDIIIFMDADCLADKDFVLQHVLMHTHFKETNQDYKVIGGGIDGYNTNIWAVCDDFASWHAYSSSLSPRESIFHPTANLSLVREILCDGNISFDEELLSGDDIGFCALLIRNGYKIYFHPKAVISHINRTNFKDFIQHSIGWTRSEFLLRKKGLRLHRPKPLFLWVLYYFWTLVIMIGAVLWNSIQAGRYTVIIYLPLIAVNKFFWCLYLFKAEMQYHHYINRKQKKIINTG